MPRRARQEGTRPLDQGAPYYWAWRADSRAILVHVNTGRLGADGERLSLLSLEPGVNRSEVRVDPGVFQAPSFSPDGKKIAYASTAQAVFTLHLSAADGSDERALATDVGGAFLEFSRDGKRIAWLAAASLQPVPEGTLTVMDLDAKPGAAPRKLSVKEAPVLEFFWAPEAGTSPTSCPTAGTGSIPCS